MSRTWKRLFLLGALASAAVWGFAREKSTSDEPVPVVGVRGLEKNDEKIDTSERDYAAIDRLGRIEITTTELQRFIKEGGLK
jgi:hypothetical protein